MAVSFAAGSPARAGMIREHFSFSNTVGNVPGTVTGEIDFAGSGIGVAATGVYVLSAPSGLGVLPATNDNFVDTIFSLIQNSFTVEANGTVDAGVFASMDTATRSFFLGLNYVGTNNLTATPPGNQDRFVYNSDGQSGVLYTPIAAAVPEPMSLALLATGVLGGCCGSASAVTGVGECVLQPSP